MDLDSLAREALEHAGARIRPVPGAKVANSMKELADAADYDFRRALQSRGVNLKTFLRSIPEVKILDQELGDFQAVFASAIDTISGYTTLDKKARYLRKDVYEAFTRIVSSGYYYVLDLDEFILAASQPPSSIAVPQPTLDELFEMRRVFARSLSSEYPDIAKALEVALGNSNGLTEFRNVLGTTPLAPEWRDSQTEQLRPKILAWATENSVRVREAWFGISKASSVYNSRPSAKDETSSLRHAINQLSDEELRSLMIPMRLVERLLKSS